jgi:hypothetical protein
MMDDPAEPLVVGADVASAQQPGALADVPARRHPLDELPPRALVRLARRADRYRRRDVTRLPALALEHDVETRQLRLLADAWAEGGAAGLRALGPATAVDPGAVERATAIIETWRRRHFPLDALQVDTWRNRVTVLWLVPSPVRGGELDRVPLMQLRWTDGGRWHLYRRAAQGEWWPVVVRGRRRRQSLSACLDTVRVDPLRQFWGDGGPPTDLAAGDGLPDLPLA